VPEGRQRGARRKRAGGAQQQYSSAGTPETCYGNHCVGKSLAVQHIFSAPDSGYRPLPDIGPWKHASGGANRVT